IRHASSTGIGCRIELVAGVKGGASAKGVSRAVEVVGPRANSHVHCGTRLTAVFGLGIFLEIKLLNGVYGQDRGPICEWTGRSGYGPGVEGIRIQNAVDHPAGLIGTNVVGALGPG